ncbi:hypothetical protein RI367_002892 [Sorochytrium milnesiophthora]
MLLLNEALIDYVYNTPGILFTEQSAYKFAEKFYPSVARLVVDEVKNGRFKALKVGTTLYYDEAAWKLAFIRELDLSSSEFGVMSDSIRLDDAAKKLRHLFKSGVTGTVTALPSVYQAVWGQTLADVRKGVRGNLTSFLSVLEPYPFQPSPTAEANALEPIWGFGERITAEAMATWIPTDRSYLTFLAEDATICFSTFCEVKRCVDNLHRAVASQPRIVCAIPPDATMQVRQKNTTRALDVSTTKYFQRMLTTVTPSIVFSKFHTEITMLHGYMTHVQYMAHFYADDAQNAPETAQRALRARLQQFLSADVSLEQNDFLKSYADVWQTELAKEKGAEKLATTSLPTWLTSELQPPLFAVERDEEMRQRIKASALATSASLNGFDPLVRTEFSATALSSFNDDCIFWQAMRRSVQAKTDLSAVQVLRKLAANFPLPIKIANDAIGSSNRSTTAPSVPPAPVMTLVSVPPNQAPALNLPPPLSVSLLPTRLTPSPALTPNAASAAADTSSSLDRTQPSLLNNLKRASPSTADMHASLPKRPPKLAQDPDPQNLLRPLSRLVADCRQSRTRAQSVSRQKQLESQVPLASVSKSTTDPKSRDAHESKSETETETETEIESVNETETVTNNDAESQSVGANRTGADASHELCRLNSHCFNQTRESAVIQTMYAFLHDLMPRLPPPDDDHSTKRVVYLYESLYPRG